MGHIVIRHLSGSKENQEDRFSLDRFREITLGRDPSSSVMFSDEIDVVVGRQHARITRNPALTSMFFITDLGSRNGTFVNRKRILGAANLEPGDVVQCGIGGPEFRFDIEQDVEAANAAGTPRPTADAIQKPPMQAKKPKPAFIPPPAISPGQTNIPMDKASDEVLNYSTASQGRKRATLVSGVLIGLIALVAGYIGYRNFRENNSSQATQPETTPDQTASPEASPEKYDHVHLSGAAAEAEKDAQRATWRIDVAPYLTLGSGGPGASPNDFDKPAGVAFSPSGLLFIADDGNRRVHIWDVKTGSRLGEFGQSDIGGSIASLAISPDNQILISDRTRNLAYAFAPAPQGASTSNGKRLGPYDYRFSGPRFSQQGFVKLGGIAVDSKGRVYVVDALRNDVLRFNPEGTTDASWKFDRTRTDGDSYLHGCDAIAIDEAGGELFLASEKDAVVEIFDLETGAYKNRTIGAGKDASGKSSGKRVFFGSVRGLAVTQRRLLAVDESAGHIHIFNLDQSEAFNTDLDGYAAPQAVRGGGYQGFFGQAPLVDFEDKTNSELRQQVKSGDIVPGKANPPGHFCSPGSIASHTDRASGETYIAVADQCNYRIAIYRWSDIAKASGNTGTLAKAAPGTEKVASKPAVAPAGPTSANKINVAPGPGKVTIVNLPRPAKTGAIRPGNKVTGARKDIIGVSPNKNKRTAQNGIDPTVSGKKAKKAKKEKKVKF